MLGACSNPSVVVKIRKNGSEGRKINNDKETCCTLRWADFITIEMLTASSPSAVGQLRECLPC